MSLYRIAARVALAAAVVLVTGTPWGLSARAEQSAPAAPPSGRDVIARHVAAIGGAPAFKAVSAFHARGTFEVVAAGLKGTFELWAARPNRVLHRATLAGVGAIETGFNGQHGWTVSPIAGPELLSGRMLAEIRDDARFDGTLHEADFVSSVSQAERATFDGRDAYKVNVVYVSGRQSVEYFDAQAGWQIGTESERATPQGVVPTVSMFRDYRKFGALMQPTSLSQTILGFEQVITITTIEATPVDDKAFLMPPAVAALVPK